MLEFWYIERGLLVNALSHTKLFAHHTHFAGKGTPRFYGY